ncbi:MAG: hypothetical protein GY703_25465 [Gammaproteobacteria bacterium]|nr:hypothetical protein [Gammaproteobacteria bacterium]
MTSTTLPTVPTILKTDTLGRIHTPRDQREALLDAFEQSGMNGAAFCRSHGLRYTTFASWRHARRRKAQRNETIDLSEEDVGVSFHEVEVNAPPPPAQPLVIELPQGARMHLERTEQFPMAAAWMAYLKETGGC